MEGETNFSSRLKQFDGLTLVTPTPSYFTTDLRHWQTASIVIINSLRIKH